jgi:enoyl-CoA hydratase/long-chain 3-hydroxyacyl-CoA dehydrogenase
LTTCFGERFAGADPEVLNSLVKAGITGINLFLFHLKYGPFRKKNCVCVLGRKSGKGFFVYEKGTKGERPICTEAMDLLKKYSLVPKGLQSDEDIQFRLATRFINEVPYSVICELQNTVVNFNNIFYLFI